jgi:hypothetical protein
MGTKREEKETSITHLNIRLRRTSTPFLFGDGIQDTWDVVAATPLFILIEVSMVLALRVV